MSPIGKKEEGKGKREEGRRKKEEGRRLELSLGSGRISGSGRIFMQSTF
jgi:hypothetical protein